ncbi:hypothetical protein BB559_002904 [Furculomyces boomerangus]|uniref:Protein kinase domain-containing protein n=1 Tax=Furculomyces boomerangus TaxID=61424 RepID=A0A2T9YR84_9FUNG|nr:hypothetical protein BB559_002904 [Furculomyces boomerangus]
MNASHKNSSKKSNAKNKKSKNKNKNGTIHKKDMELAPQSPLSSPQELKILNSNNQRKDSPLDNTQAFFVQDKGLSDKINKEEIQPNLDNDTEKHKDNLLLFQEPILIEYKEKEGGQKFDKDIKTNTCNNIDAGINLNESKVENSNPDNFGNRFSLNRNINVKKKQETNIYKRTTNPSNSPYKSYGKTPKNDIYSTGNYKAPEIKEKLTKYNKVIVRQILKNNKKVYGWMKNPEENEQEYLARKRSRRKTFMHIYMKKTQQRVLVIQPNSTTNSFMMPGNNSNANIEQSGINDVISPKKIINSPNITYDTPQKIALNKCINDPIPVKSVIKLPKKNLSNINYNAQKPIEIPQNIQNQKKDSFSDKEDYKPKSPIVLPKSNILNNLVDTKEKKEQAFELPTEKQKPAFELLTEKQKSILELPTEKQKSVLELNTEKQKSILELPTKKRSNKELSEDTDIKSSNPIENHVSSDNKIISISSAKSSVVNKKKISEIKEPKEKSDRKLIGILNPSKRYGSVANMYTPQITVSLKSMKSKKFLFNTPLGEYETIKTLGQGSYGKVKLMKNTLTQQKYAVKIIKRYSQSKHKKSHPEYKKAKTLDRRVLREANLCRVLGELHPHIISLHDFRMTEKHFYLFYEYINGPTLAERVGNNGIPENEAREIFKPIAETVRFCHSYSIIHRDLKLENILIDYSSLLVHKKEKGLVLQKKEEKTGPIGCVKLIDFGLANFFTQTGIMETFCGSLPYTAPEILRGEQYNGPEIDIWSLGVLLYVVVTGRFPFDDPSKPKNFEKIMEGDFELRADLSSDLQRLLVMMLEPDIEKRLTIEQVLSHSWFSNLENIDDIKGGCCILHPENVSSFIAIPESKKYMEISQLVDYVVVKEVSTCLEIPAEDVVKIMRLAIIQNESGVNENIGIENDKSVVFNSKNLRNDMNQQGDCENFGIKNMSFVRNQNYKDQMLVRMVKSPVVSMYHLVSQNIEQRKWYLSPADDINIESNYSVATTLENQFGIYPKEKSKIRRFFTTKQKVLSKDSLNSPVKNKIRKTLKRFKNQVGINQNRVLDVLGNNSMPTINTTSDNSPEKVSSCLQIKNIQPEIKRLDKRISLVDKTSIQSSEHKIYPTVQTKSKNNLDVYINNMSCDLGREDHTGRLLGNVSKYSLVSMFGLKDSVSEMNGDSKKEKISNFSLGSLGINNHNKKYIEFGDTKVGVIGILDAVNERIMLPKDLNNLDPVYIMDLISDLLKSNDITFTFVERLVYSDKNAIPVIQSARRNFSRYDGHVGLGASASNQYDIDIFGPLIKSQVDINTKKNEIENNDAAGKENFSNYIKHGLLKTNEGKSLRFRKQSLSQKLKSITGLVFPNSSQVISSETGKNKNGTEKKKGGRKDSLEKKVAAKDKKEASNANNSSNCKNENENTKKKGKRNSDAKLRTKNEKKIGEDDVVLPEGYVWTTKMVRGKNRRVMVHVSELDGNKIKDIKKVGNDSIKSIGNGNKIIKISKLTKKLSKMFTSDPSKHDLDKSNTSPKTNTQNENTNINSENTNTNNTNELASKKLSNYNISNLKSESDPNHKIMTLPVDYTTTAIIAQYSPSLSIKNDSEVVEHYSCSFKLELVFVQTPGIGKRYAVVLTKMAGHNAKFSLVHMFMKRMINTITCY